MIAETATTKLYVKGDFIQVKVGGRWLPCRVSADQVPLYAYIFYRDLKGGEHCARLENVRRAQ